MKKSHRQFYSNNFIQNYLNENYVGFKKIIEINLLEHNNKNSVNYLIKTKNGNFVLRNFFNNSDVKLEKIFQILDFCDKKKCKTMKPILNKNNQFIDKNNLSLTKFYDGNFFLGTKNELNSFSTALSVLHKSLREYDLTFRFRLSKDYCLLNNAEFLSIRTILKRKKDLSLFDKILLKNFNYIKNQIKKDRFFLEFLSTKKFTKQIIHGDLHPLNIIFKNHNLQTIIDFSSMHYGYLIGDISFAAYRFAIYATNKTNNRFSIIQDFSKNYLSHNPKLVKEFNFLNDFARHEFLFRVCYILRNYYFHDSNLWTNNLSKHLNSLKLVDKIELKNKKLK